MRVNLKNGNGYVCDLCTKEIKPFDVVTVKCLETVKGPTYPKVSSDIREKQIAKIHLCKGCYSKIESKMKPIVKKNRENIEGYY